MKIVITGATGTIGHALIDELTNQGAEIFALCRPNSEGIKALPKNKQLHVLQIDLAQLTEAKSLLPCDCDVFYHFGWEGTFGALRNDAEVQEKNIQYTLDAVDLAYDCGCHTFVGAGSQAEYGRYEGGLSSNTPCFPESGYGIAKLCAGQLSRLKAKSLGVKHVWARIVSIFGTYDEPRTMIISAIIKFLKSEKASFTKGEQLWDYLYCEDAAKAMVALGSEKSTDGKVYVLGSGMARPLRDYITIIRDMIDKNLPIGFGEVPYSEQQVMHLCADISEITKDTGWKPQVSFEEGIKRTIDFVRENISNGE